MTRSTIKTLIIAVLLLVLAGGVFGFMFLETRSKGAVLEEQITTLATQRTQEESFFRLRSITEETVTERAEIREYFLTNESESIEFLTYVEELAPQAGVTLTTESLEAITDADQQDWIEVDFRFQGTRTEVQRFVKILENLPFLGRLTRLEIASQSSQTWVADVTMVVRILSYEN